MKRHDELLWTIAQLRDAVAAALEEGYDGPPNGRVRDVPDQRTIRYYTTIGLLDRAAEMRGRTAFYGRRHLLQLVAIKKLQAQGQSLAEIQRALIGQTNAALSRLAGVGHVAVQEKSAPRANPQRAFWKQEPASARPPRLDEIERVEAESTDARSEANDRLQPFQGVPLAANVTLLLGTSRRLEDKELEALRMACGPLIDLLTRLKITPPPVEGDPR
jgi:DNA-binding transcriptional MerR regulator